MRRFLLSTGKKVLPRRFIKWYRRRRALRRYLAALAFELYDRQIKVDMEVLEGRLAARRDGYYDRLVRDVLERTELVMQELDRRIEGLSSRHGNELRDLRDELAEIRAKLGDTLPAAAGPID
jgi:predicted kinase